MRVFLSFRLMRACRPCVLPHHRVATVILLGACAATLAGCTQHAPATPAPAFVRDGQRLHIPPHSPLRTRLVIAPVELRAAPHWLQVPGNVEADPAHVANVLPALAGRVSGLAVDIGAHVERGQLLATLDSGDMAQAYADVAKARDALALARKTLARERGVASAGGAAVKDLEAAQSGATQAAAEYRRAQARLAALGGAGAAVPRPLAVRAPISGTVTALSIAPGAFVNDPTAPIMTIANIDRVWVVAGVPGDQLGLVHAGQAARFEVPAWPRREFRGTVASVGVLLDADTRRDKVRIAAANPGHALKPGMFATVALAVRQPAEVLVPASALLMNNDDTTVWVEVSPWTFVRRRVEPGYDEGGDVRVLGGLKAGERVIVAGGVLLNDD